LRCRRGSGSLAWIAVASLLAYVRSFAIGLGPVVWLMLSEIYPLGVRGRAVSVGTCTNWSANLIEAVSFLTLIQLLGWPTMLWLYRRRSTSGHGSSHSFRLGKRRLLDNIPAGRDKQVRSVDQKFDIHGT
jgi:hypothetical protein